MRETSQIKPRPKTREQILAHGLGEIAMLAPGGHQEDPCYGARRQIKDFALRVLDEANEARPHTLTKDCWCAPEVIATKEETDGGS